MLKKIFFSLIILISLPFLVSPVHASKTYYVENFDTHVEIHLNGAIIVTETIEVHSDGGPLTDFYREISQANIDGLIFLEASMDGFPMQQGIKVGQVEVNGNPLRVTWHFAQTNDVVHLFVVRYRVDGAVLKNQADILVWRFIPKKHEYIIKNASITIHYPPDLHMLEAPTLDRVFVSMETAFGLRLITHNLAADESAILTASFPLDSLARFAPQWQTQMDAQNAAIARTTQIGLLAGLVTIIIAGVVLYARLRTSHRMS